MKEIGRVAVDIDNLYSLHFNCPILEIPYIRMVEQELRDNPSMHNSEYYAYLKKELDRGVEVFGTIKTEKQLENRYHEWKKLIASIRRKYKDNKKYEIYENGLPYGGITALLKEDKIEVVDGHHRLAILLALGYDQVNIILFRE